MEKGMAQPNPSNKGQRIIFRSRTKEEERTWARTHPPEAKANAKTRQKHAKAKHAKRRQNGNRKLRSKKQSVMTNLHEYREHDMSECSTRSRKTSATLCLPPCGAREASFPTSLTGSKVTPLNVTLAATTARLLQLENLLRDPQHGTSP